MAAQSFFLDAVDFAGDVMPMMKKEKEEEKALHLYLLGAGQSGKTTFLDTLKGVVASADGEVLPLDASLLQPTEGLIEVELMQEKSSRFPLPLNVCAYELGGEGGDWDVLGGEEGEAAAVLFFLAADEVEEKKEKMEGLKALFEEVKGLGYNPLVVLTRMDLVEPAIASDPFNWYVPSTHPPTHPPVSPEPSSLCLTHPPTHPPTHTGRWKKSRTSVVASASSSVSPTCKPWSSCPMRPPSPPLVLGLSPPLSTVCVVGASAASLR